MDNFHIDITAEGNESLSKAVGIAFSHNAPGGKATHYREVRLIKETSYYAHDVSEASHFTENVHGLPGKFIHHNTDAAVVNDKGVLTLVLCWSDDDKTQKLPFPLDEAGAIEFIKGWLKANGDAGREPDHDGSNGSGWRVFTTEWGHVGSLHYGICGVQAAWAMYGK